MQSLAGSLALVGKAGGFSGNLCTCHVPVAHVDLSNSQFITAMSRLVVFGCGVAEQREVTEVKYEMTFNVV